MEELTTERDRERVEHTERRMGSGLFELESQDGVVESGAVPRETRAASGIRMSSSDSTSTTITDVTVPPEIFYLNHLLSKMVEVRHNLDGVCLAGVVAVCGVGQPFAYGILGWPRRIASFGSLVICFCKLTRLGRWKLLEG